MILSVLPTTNILRTLNSNEKESLNLKLGFFDVYKVGNTDISLRFLCILLLFQSSDEMKLAKL